MKRYLSIKKASEYMGFSVSYIYKITASDNHLTVSELTRGWIHEVIKRKEYRMREPLLLDIRRDK